MRKDLIFYNLAGLIGGIAYPHLILAFVFSKSRDVITSDICRWQFYRPQYFSSSDKTVYKLAKLLALRSEFRSQFLFRIGGLSQYLLKVITIGGGNSCYIERGTQIDGGLVIMHGNGVVIGGGCVIGRDCTVFQNVTIGNADGFPTIGNNVMIGAGANIIGPVIIGNNVKIGANATVVENVPNDSTVVGPKAKLIFHDRSNTDS